VILRRSGLLFESLAEFWTLHDGWQASGVVFVADALWGWPVGQLADAGRKKLTELIPRQ
jgi:hypothetical protein